MTASQSKHSVSSATADLRPVIRSKSLFAPVIWILAIAAAAIALSPVLQELLQFDAAAIVVGDYWRFLTGHLLHWNFDHLFWNLSVFVVLGTMCERRGRTAFLACLLGSAAAISFFALVALPEMPIYRGLSGIDTGLFALLCVGLFADARARGNRTTQWMIAAAALGLITKTAYEMGSDATIFVDHTAAAFIPIPMAHVLGALVGVAVGFTAIAWHRHRSQVDRSDTPATSKVLLAKKLFEITVVSVSR
ncbi:MAG: rhombosortase [Planctomycetota bacterium]|nr:rhombosortase [Planctomycetota bacterium]